MRFARTTRLAVPFIAVATALTACGGGNNPTPTPTRGTVVDNEIDYCDSDSGLTVHSGKALPLATRRPSSSSNNSSTGTGSSVAPPSPSTVRTSSACRTEYELTIRTAESGDVEEDVTQATYDACTDRDREHYPDCSAT